MEHNRPIGHTLVQLTTGQCMVKLARTKEKHTYIFKNKEFGRCTVFQCTRNRISRGGLRSDGF